MIGDRIREFRIEKGLTVEELAEGILSPKYIQDIENNTRHLPDDILPEIASRLGTSVDFLLGIEEETNIRKANELLDSALRYTYRDLVDLAKENVIQVNNLGMSFTEELKIKFRIVECQILIKDENIDEANKLFDTIEEKNVSEYDALHFMYQRVKGVLHFFKDEFWKAIKCFMGAIDSKINFEKNAFEVALCYFNLGVTYGHIGNYSLGEQHFKDAEQILQDIGEIKLLTDCLINLGNIYSGQNKYEDALDTYKKAQNLLVYNSDLRKSSFIFNNIGVLYHKLKNYKKGIEYGNRALALKRKVVEYPHEIINSLDLLANCYLNLGEFEMADIYVQEIESLLPKIQRGKVLGGICETLGLFFKDRGNNERYIKYFKLSIDAYKKAELWYKAADVSYKLGKELNDFKYIENAADLFYKYHTILNND
ncbi:helix-turn-helix transcriptional regulator [Alteribacter natronophilus]|uniref:helix-turn-helix transcriptional regulator n=1 Tax=Alteribacter natronophilus TaxID=2583810 RepID=UPI00110E18B3|nr:helix-turn-helix transcriptional regulator [Alteribacter natronophilus]TMW73482.1 helix-turn-helix transcriptional regulator [Alteribacter natronophilus]